MNTVGFFSVFCLTKRQPLCEGMVVLFVLRFYGLSTDGVHAER